MYKLNFWLVIIVLIIVSSCSSEGDEFKELKNIESSNTLFTLLSPDETNVTFSNDLTENNINNSFKYEYFYNGGGVSLGDINNDGLVDIYFTGNMVKDKIYLNKGNLEFEDITETAILSDNEGWHTGTTMADVNGDGFLDIYVCRAGYIGGNELKSNLLYINNGDLTFTEKAEEYGLADTLLSTQASFFDYDLDGDLDVYLLNVPNQLFNKSIKEYYQMFKDGENQSDHFYRNDDGKFTDISYQARISNHAFGLGVSVGDLNNDGYPDVYVSNDYEVRDYMFINNGSVFYEELKNRTKHISNFGMGTDIADFNNDGDMDIVEMDMAYPSHIRSKRNMASMSSEKFWNQVGNGEHFQYMVNTLQVNNGNATFSDIGQMAKISKTDWSWGSLLADFDNDGFKDLVITNGYKRDLTDRDFQTAYKNKREENRKMDVSEVLDLAPVALVSNYIFKNTGDLVFKDHTDAWGFNKQVNSHGVAYADLDNDGDLDLVVNNLDEVSSIYKNNSNQNYLAVQLKGVENNKFAIGTKVTLHLKEEKQTQELFLTRGFQSSVSTKLNFGLGSNDEIDKIEIRWPDQKTTIIENVSVNQILTVSYEKSDFTSPIVEVKQPLFATITNPIDTGYLHQENGFNDFDREVLLPHILSRQGPCMTVADVNADGLDDLFIGGAKGSNGNLYIQSTEGKFSLSNSSVFSNDKISEDLGSLFFDSDNDGDLDLYVTSGGNDYDKKDKAFQDRLYLNNGRGDFVKSKGRLPNMITSTKIVKSADFDADGDLDLFVGGRLVAGKYPTAPRSYLLENNDGNFTDVTEKYCKDLLNPGMVTGAEFNDVNGDGKVDLTLVGEWMGFTTFFNNGNAFEKQNVKPESEGLWFSLVATDIDKDGDIDYVAGNLGSNSKFKASLEKPFNVYGNDFDKNGSFDLVLSSYEGEINYPVRGRECSSQQMPFITDKCPTYKDFAEADMNDIYGKDLEDALHLTVRNLYSSIFINDGEGNFEIKKLPNMAQFSPILGMQIEDINNDGNLDILAAGNMYGAEVETVRYDAGRGVCLLGNGDGTFISLSPKESGFFAWDNIKSLEKIKIANRNVYLVGINNGRLKAFNRVKQ
jgi:hypothetical protein